MFKLNLLFFRVFFVYATLVIKRCPEALATPLTPEDTTHVSTSEDGQARGLNAEVDCSKSSGKCYHVEDGGKFTYDPTYNLADYRRYQRTSASSNNSISLNVIQQQNNDQEERMALMEVRLKDEMKDHVALRQVITWSAVFGTFLMLGVVFGLKRLYDHHCSTKATLKKKADKQLEEIRALFEKDPEHMYYLVRELLVQHPVTWLRQQHANRVAEDARRVQAQDEAQQLLKERQLLHYNNVRTHAPIQYEQHAV